MHTERIFDSSGRQGERRTSVDSEGRQVIEEFFPEPRPLKLEKRIVREMASVVARETHETLKDGEIVLREEHSSEASQPLQIVSRIGLADSEGDYVKSSELSKLITSGVVARIAKMMEQIEPVAPEAPPGPKPLLTGFGKIDMMQSVLGILVVSELAFLAFYLANW